MDRIIIRLYSSVCSAVQCTHQAVEVLLKVDSLL